MVGQGGEDYEATEHGGLLVLELTPREEIGQVIPPLVNGGAFWMALDPLDCAVGGDESFAVP